MDGHDKDSTKTGENRRVVLCPRAMGVLKRQLALRAKLEREGAIDHEYLFFKTSGASLRNLQYTHKRWQQTFIRLRTLRYRKPYARGTPQ